MELIKTMSFGNGVTIKFKTRLDKTHSGRRPPAVTKSDPLLTDSFGSRKPTGSQ